MMSRRRMLEGAALLAAAALPATGAADEPAGAVATDADIDRILPTISNWGRWGPDDQLGTLNLITPAMRLDAARSIDRGRTVSLARERAVTDDTGIRKATYRNYHYLDPQPDEAGTIDEIGMIYHGFVVTHLDALCHLFTPEGRDGMYNGYPVSLVTDAGAAKLGVEAMGASGIVGRGVLLDIAALKGAPASARQHHHDRRPRGGGATAGRHRRRGRHPLRPQRPGQPQQLRARHRPAPGLPALAARARRRAAQPRRRRRRAPAAAGPRALDRARAHDRHSLPRDAADLRRRPRGDLGRLRRRRPLELLRHRRALAVQGGDELPGQSRSPSSDATTGSR